MNTTRLWRRLAVGLFAFAVACGSDSDNNGNPQNGNGAGDGGRADAAASTMRDAADAGAVTDAPAASDVKTPSSPTDTADAQSMTCSARLDPAPTRQSAGAYAVDGGPASAFEMDDLVLEGESSHTFTGNVTGAEGDGTFYVIKLDQTDGGAGAMCASEFSGTVATNTGTGIYSATIPLFCGTQLVKLVWRNGNGQLVLVQKVITTGCTEADIRLTIAWDHLGEDWELHLIKPGGRINDDATDCTWTSCIDKAPDWGVMGDSSDDPSKDVDNTGTLGPENIILSKPEAGRYHVLIEHWGAGQPSQGQCIINVRGRVTIVPISNFATRHVRTVATIDWPSQTVTVLDSDYDCSDNWNDGCLDKLP